MVGPWSPLSRLGTCLCFAASQLNTAPVQPTGWTPCPYCTSHNSDESFTAARLSPLLGHLTKACLAATRLDQLLDLSGQGLHRYYPALPLARPSWSRLASPLFGSAICSTIRSCFASPLRGSANCLTVVVKSCLTAARLAELLNRLLKVKTCLTTAWLANCATLAVTACIATTWLYHPLNPLWSRLASPLRGLPVAQP